MPRSRPTIFALPMNHAPIALRTDDARERLRTEGPGAASPAQSVDFGTLIEQEGRIALSYDRGCERQAFIAGAVLADILSQPVCLSGAGAVPLAPLVRVHVGGAMPSSGAENVCLLIQPSASQADTLVVFDEQPWSQYSLLRIPALGWAAARTSHEIVLGSDQGAICTRQGNVWTLNADLTGVCGREALRHATADVDVAACMGGHLALRAVLARMGLFKLENRGGMSLITVDAEDQQRYFINRLGVCSNVRGAPSDDLQFAKSCRTIMDRCEGLGLKAIFMVTGDELDESFVDAFGDRLIGLDDNHRVLGEITARGHDTACHGFDHEWWLSKGRSPMTPMTMLQKLGYFAETSGDLRTLFGIAKFLVSHRRLLARARAAKRKREVTRFTPFTYEEVRDDFERWMALVRFDSRRLFVRYPGYVRSGETLNYLDDRFAAVVDSSDVYELDLGLPVFPYRLLAERNGTLRRTNVTEIPCLWIDKVLRTRNQARVAADLEALRKIVSFPGSILSLVTHTKVLGAEWGHCHLYLHDPLRGMALPIVQESWQGLASLLASSTRSCNWRDLQQAVYGCAA
jgi:hypothetical protein